MCRYFHAYFVYIRVPCAMSFAFACRTSTNRSSSKTTCFFLPRTTNVLCIYIYMNTNVHIVSCISFVPCALSFALACRTCIYTTATTLHTSSKTRLRWRTRSVHTGAQMFVYIYIYILSYIYLYTHTLVVLHSEKRCS